MEVDFTRVVEENQSLVFSLALRFLRDRAGAEELSQEVFLQLYQQLHRIETPAHATWWLRRAICHRCIDEARLRRLVSGLPQAARMVVLLRYQEDLDPMEIAGMLNMPLSTVKSHLHRSLAVLRGKLERQEVCG